MSDLFQCLWLSIINTGFLWVLSILIIILLCATDQGRDFMIAILQDKFRNKQNLLFFILIFLWCYIMWYGASIILQVNPYTAGHHLGYLEKIAGKVTYFMGLLPAIIIAFAFIIINYRIKKVWFSKEIIFPSAMSVLIGIAAIFLFASLDKGNYDWPSFALEEEQCEIKDFSQFEVSKFLIINFDGISFYFSILSLVFISLLLVFCNTRLNIIISLFLGPSNIAVIGFIFLTYVSSTIFFFSDLQTLPLFIIILVYASVLSCFNDNTKPLYQKTDVERLNLETIFNKWVNNLKQNNKEEIPLYIIASQGGGIRGMKWSGLVLDELNKASKGQFINNTLCIGGVSGGGVGSTMYLSYLKDNPSKKFNEFLSADYLSPVLAGLIFPDLIQKLIPFKISGFDRSKILGKAWSNNYSKLLGKSTFKDKFLDNFSKSNDLPGLFINGTIAETGQRIVTSSFIYPESHTDEVIDFYKHLDKLDIFTYAAALNCCRFPGLTSGALYHKNNKAIGHIVDGGYRENTGLASALDILYEILPYIKQHNEINNKKIKPHIIYIKNAADEDYPIKSKALKLFHDFGLPVMGAISSNGSGKSQDFLVDQVDKMSKQDNQFNFNCISLDFYHSDDEVALPLGWYLSNKASNAIDNAVDKFTGSDIFKSLTGI